jgi:parallel beta-helix repeat protein
MASQTPNMDLRKPTNNDTVNVVTDLSANFDKIDAHAHSGTYVSWFDVTRYGAVGNGIANDGPAIALAVAAASAAGGGVVYFPAGTYLVTTAQGAAPSTRSMLYFNGSAYDDIAFVGVGAQSIIKITHATAGILELRDCSRVVVRDLAFLGAAVGGVLGSNRNSNADISGAGIRLTGVIHGTATGNYLSQLGYSAIYVTGGSQFCDVTDNHIYDCTIIDWANGINEDSLAGTSGGGDATPRGCVISGNRISNVLGSGGIVVDNNGIASFTQVYGNVVDGDGGYQGIRLLNCQNVTVEDNIVRASEDSGIYAFSSVAMSAVQILGNQLQGCGVGATAPGIVVTSTGGSLPRDVLVSDNIVRGAGSVGIYVSNVTDVLVHGNIVQGSGSKGIQAFYDAARQGVTISDNIVADSTNEGIQLQATAVLSFCAVSGNHVRHNDAAGIRFSPSSPTFIADVRVTGNILEANDEATPGTTDGITIDGTKIFIDGNVVDGAGTHHRYGLVIAATATAIEVGQNILTGSLTADYLDASGTATGFPGLYSQLLTTGEANMPPDLAANGSIPTGNQSLRLRYFTARKTETISQVRVITGGTPAGATPTIVRIGIWTADLAGALIARVGATPNDTTLLAAGSTAYTKALSASFTKIAGQRYATGLLVVTAATAPVMWGLSLPTPLAGTSPKRGGLIGGQADLPAAGVAAGSVSDAGNMPYIELLP